MKDRVEMLMNLLFDKTASITERDEAATDLSEFSDTRAVIALLKKGKDLSENALVLNSCGESLGTIWSNNGIFDDKSYHALSGTARYGAFAVIKYKKPEWLVQYQLEKDDFSN